MRASVVFPEPGGPQKMHDATSPRRISSPRALPEPSSCSWPRNSSSVRGRMRAARGSEPGRPPELWKSVASDTGDGRRETGERHEKRPSQQEFGEGFEPPAAHLGPVRNLESFDAWKCGRDLAQRAYRLTLQRPLNRHFALSDQIRRAALSIPANIAEGYALGTTPQFIRCLRISLGSTAELRAHLELGLALNLAATVDAAEAMKLCDRMLTILLGLIRRLNGKDPSRLPSPVSRLPINEPTLEESW